MREDFLFSLTLIPALHCFPAPFPSPPPWLLAHQVENRLVLSSSVTWLKFKQLGLTAQTKGKGPSPEALACQVHLLSTTVPSQVILRALIPAAVVSSLNPASQFPFSGCSHAPLRSCSQPLHREDSPPQLPLSRSVLFDGFPLPSLLHTRLSYPSLLSLNKFATAFKIIPAHYGNMRNTEQNFQEKVLIISQPRENTTNTF